MAKPGINLGALDLNLLTVFDAIMVERNVTRAAMRVGLSQPATSHALNRLRHMLRDDLFIRSPKGMQPTPRAEQLAPAIRTALAGLQQALEPARFEASEATRQFRIAVDNYSAVVLVGALAGKLAKLAPKATLECRPSGTLPVHDMLDRGELDLALGPYGAQGERFSHRTLLIDDFVVVMRGEHPAARHKNLSMAAFAALPHLEITSIPFATDFIDEALAAEGLRRRVQLRAPLLSSVRILAASDMVTVMRRRIAEEVVRHRPLAVFPLPHAAPLKETAMIWPKWLDDQPSHVWLRDTIESVTKKLSLHRDPPPGGPQAKPAPPSRT